MENDLRKVKQALIGKDRQVSPQGLNEQLRQISAALHKLEGRSGEVNIRDNVKITTNKFTALDIESSSGKSAIVAFGNDNSGLALAKGSRRNESGQWIATDSVSVIWAISREGWGALYVNSNLRIGEAFSPTEVATIPGGTSPLGHAGLSGRSDANAHPATAVSNTPAGDIASTNVQSAINELDSEKAKKTTTISTTAPLQGGGDISANRTLSIDTFTGDGGTGGTKGAVPAPSAGDAAAGKYLKADGNWTVPPTGAGGGDSLLAAWYL
jgi:hypothetical protein